MGDSQTATSGTSTHRHSQNSSDGGSLRTGTTEVEIGSTGTYMKIEGLL